ncbi:MAG: hypothetical protein ACK52I_36530 [Pseudomonadota bacterium]
MDTNKIENKDVIVSHNMKIVNQIKININYDFNRIAEYINALSIIYNNSNYLISITNNEGSFLFLSKTMQKYIENFNFSSIRIINDFIMLNKKIFQSGQTLKYIYLAQTHLWQDMLFKGTKYPIYENDKVIAILTIEHELNLINLEHLDDDRNYCFEFSDYKLTDIENLILFFSSFGFSSGETYQFILKHNEINVKFDNFKYYWRQLLRIFHVSTMKELIENNCVLKSRRFIPQKLLRNKIFLLSSSLN